MVDDCSGNWFKKKVQMVFPYHKVRWEVEVKDPAVPALQPNAALPSPRFSGTRHTANPAPPLHHLDVLLVHESAIALLITMAPTTFVK